MFAKMINWLSALHVHSTRLLDTANMAILRTEHVILSTHFEFESQILARLIVSLHRSNHKDTGAAVCPCTGLAECILIEFLTYFDCKV